MPAPERRAWLRLVGVAVLVARVMVPVAFTALMGLHAATRTMWGPAADPPIWLMGLAVTVVAGLLLVPGVVVGRVARLRRGWLVIAAVTAALAATCSAALVAVTTGGEVTPVGAIPGLIGGSLLAVVLADRSGPSRRSSVYARSSTPPKDWSRSGSSAAV